MRESIREEAWLERAVLQVLATDREQTYDTFPPTSSPPHAGRS